MGRSGGQVERIAASWLARRDGDHWSLADQSALAAWLEQDPAHRVAFLRLQAAWRETGRLKALAAGTPQGQLPERGAWRRSPYFNPPSFQRGDASGRGRRHGSRPSRFASPVAAIAAGLLVILLAGGFWWWRDAGRVERRVWQTELGGQKVVHLTDGSTATLAGDSELHASMTRRERDLDLVRGEAFFEVAKDHARPFVVHASGYRVIAVGTRFDVRRESDGLRVVVTRGVVRLQSAVDLGQAPTELPAGSIARVRNDEVFVQHVGPEQALQHLGWRSGYAVFHDTPLVEAIGEFNRYNARQIVIADPSLDDLKVGGNFRLDNSDAFVRLLQQVFPVHAERRGDRIMLSRAGRKQAPD
jgi:transmembrane sensor